jgi:hypothetical protein
MAQDIKYIIAISGQSIFDLVISTYGDLNLTYKFIQDNNISNIDASDLTGKTFKFDVNNIANKGFFVSLKNKIATKPTVASGSGNAGSFLLTESGDFLTTESGDKFEIEI